MKNILRIITLLTVTLFVAVGCDYDESQYDVLTNKLDATNTDYYVQFKNANKSLRTGVDASGNLVNISTTIDVALLGAPQAQDVVVKLTIDPTTTISPDKYTLSATSVTIPAGKTSASVTLTAFAAKMAIDQTVKLVINLDAGAKNAPAGLKLNYSLYRICALDPSTIVGNWTLKMEDSYGDGWNGAAITAVIDGVSTDHTLADGLSGTKIVNVPAGSKTLKFLFKSGDWDSEVTFEILAPNGNVAGKGGPTPKVGEIVLNACVL